MNQKANALTMLIAMNNILSDELTRFIGLFKHEKKSCYNRLVELTAIFQESKEYSIEANNFEEVSRIKEYWHDLISDMIKYGYTDLEIVSALCFTVNATYYQFLIKDGFKGKALIEMIANQSNLFYKLNPTNEKLTSFFKDFSFTLINEQEFVFERHNI